MRLGDSYISFGGPVFLLDHLKEQKSCLNNSSFSAPDTHSQLSGTVNDSNEDLGMGRWERHNKTELGSQEL